MKTADCSMNLKTFDFEIDIISKLKKKDSYVNMRFRYLNAV